MSRRNVLVCGSRDWDDYDAVYGKLCELDPESWEILEGGARGADTAAVVAAQALDLHVRTFAPDPAVPSPQRYHDRNDEMLALADRVIAFWDGKSRGTKSVIAKATDRGLEVEVVPAKSHGNRLGFPSAPRRHDG